MHRMGSSTLKKTDNRILKSTEGTFAVISLQGNSVVACVLSTSTFTEQGCYIYTACVSGDERSRDGERTQLKSVPSAWLPLGRERKCDCVAPVTLAINKDDTSPKLRLSPVKTDESGE